MRIAAGKKARVDVKPCTHIKQDFHSIKIVTLARNICAPKTCALTMELFSIYERSMSLISLQRDLPP